MSEAWVAVFFLVLLGVWVLLPLVPAWLTYRITPDQTLGLSGPLQGLTLRASGAFAAYLVVLLLVALYGLPRGFDLLGSMQSPAWRIRGPILVQDHAGNPAKLATEARPLLLLDPDLAEVAKTTFTVRLPGQPDSWPEVRIGVEGFGWSEPTRLDTWDPNMEIDPFRKLVVIQKPIIIRQFPPNLEVSPFER
jgi:hypothetical protein